MVTDFSALIALLEKTGDRCVVLDASGKPAYAIMTVGQYQRLVTEKTNVAGLSEEDLIEKINQDIASWRLSQNNEGGVELEDNLSEPVAPIAAKKPKKSLNQADISESQDAFEFEPIE